MVFTSVLSLRNDFTKQFREVWQIFPEELGLDYQRFSGVVCTQLTSQKLCFSGDSKGGSLVGILATGSY